MSVNNSDYQVKISTELDDSGVKKATTGFEQLGKATERANEPIKETAKAHEDAGKKSEEGSKKQVEGAEHATLSHRELRESIRAVANQFGGLADVGLWLSPVTAALAIILTAVDALKKAWEELRAPVEAANEAMQAIDDAKLKAAADSAHSLSSAMADIKNEEDRLDEAYRTGDAAIDARIKKYNEEIEALLRLEEAKEKAYEAEIQRQVKLHHLSEEQGQALTEAARLQLDQERGNTDQAKLKFEIDQRQQALDEARQRLQSGADAKAIKSNQGDVKDTAVQLAAAEANEKSQSAIPINVPGGDAFGHLNKNATFKDEDAIEKAIQKTKDEIESLAETGRANPWSKKTSPEGQAVQTDALKGQLAALNEALKAHRAYTDNLAEETQTLKEANNAAKSRTEASVDQLKKDKELNRTGPGSIQALQDTYNLHQTNNAAVQQQNRNAADSRTNGALSGEATQTGPTLRDKIDRTESGPKAAQDTAALEGAARTVEGLAQRQRGGHTANQEGVVEGILHRVITLLENPNLDSKSRSKLQDIERRLEHIEAQWANSGSLH